jgi:diacylglycerol O-acyltransferase / wax synthase
VQPGESERHALQRLCGGWPPRRWTRPPAVAVPPVENYEGGSALVARIHHCIGDGIALISVMLSITDGGSDPPRTRRRRRPAAEDAAEPDWLSDAVLKPLTDLTIKAIGMYGSGVGKSIEMLANPTQPLLSSMDMARSGLQVAAGRGRAGADARRLADAAQGQAEWAQARGLERAAAAGGGQGHRQGRWACTVNDVLLACAAGAIGAWLAEQGQDPAGKEIRAMVPVNLRPLDKAWQLGNRFGLAPLVLPWASPTRSSACTPCTAHGRDEGQLPAAAGLCRAQRQRACSSSRCRTPCSACSRRRPPR